MVLERLAHCPQVAILPGRDVHASLHRVSERDLEKQLALLVRAGVGHGLEPLLLPDFVDAICPEGIVLRIGLEVGALAARAAQGRATSCQHLSART